MKYLSIDIETTGLDPEKCQIIEIGAVFNDMTKRVRECPSFQCLVHHPVYSGEASALAMNERIFKQLADGKGLDSDQASSVFADWLENLLAPGEFVHLLGKNVGSFDLQFLKRMYYWPKHRIHHRCLEVGSMYATPNGMPGLNDLEATTIARDFQIVGAPHEALFDALMALAAARRKWGFDC